jgi:hypothetical protein
MLTRTNSGHQLLRTRSGSDEKLDELPAIRRRAHGSDQTAMHFANQHLQSPVQPDGEKLRAVVSGKQLQGLLRGHLSVSQVTSRWGVVVFPFSQ